MFSSICPRRGLPALDWGALTGIRQPGQQRPALQATSRPARRFAAIRAASPTWRGRGGRYCCRRSNGTTNLAIGAAGALLGREVEKELNCR
jgi:hypothetical protein